MARNVYKLLVIGLVFHLFFCYSVFDCYFTSPVVTGMQSFSVDALSKRVVLIVGQFILPAIAFFHVNQAMVSVPTFSLKKMAFLW